MPPKNIPPKKRMSVDDELDADVVALKLIELLNEENFIKKLKTMLYPQVIADKLDLLTAQWDKMSQQLDVKERRISELEQRVQQLETNADAVEQYSRRPNLRFQGIPETNGENTDAKILKLINEQMQIQPLITQDDIERSH